MRTLHGPLARNNKHIYLAYIEFLHGLDSHAVAIGNRNDLNAHIADESFQEFVATRVTMIPRGAWSTPSGLLSQFAKILGRGDFSALHLYSLYSYLPIPIDLPKFGGLQRWANADIMLLKAVEKLRRREIEISLHFQGCDLRTPLQYTGRYDFSETPCHTCSKFTTYCGASYQRARYERLSALRSYATTSFVATPDLLTLLPDATYLPQPFFFDSWGTRQLAAIERVFADNTVVRIAHAPSNEGRKGTAYVEKAIAELVASGRPVEYHKLRGLQRSAMRETLDNTHILIDQLLVGYYGNALIEGVASGAIGVVNIKVENDPADDYLVNAGPTTILPIVSTLVDRILSRDRTLPENVVRAIDYLRTKHSPDAIFRVLQAATVTR